MRNVLTVLTLSACLAGASQAAAATVYVSNWGTDSGSCGASTSPCRSITQGIANSAVGGSIVVGPGMYGDLDNDGTDGETGEETIGFAGGEFSLVNVDKSVTITSSAGAFSTIIHAGPGGASQTVGINAPDVTFGAVGKGFSVRASANINADVIGSSTVATNAVIAGNIVYPPATSGGGIWALGAGTLLQGNRSEGGYIGIGLGADGTIAGNVVTNATHSGFYTYGTIEFTGNVANGNGYGLQAHTGTTNVTKSSFVGNWGPGIIMLNATTNVASSNIAGNSPFNNCGTSVLGGAASLTATGNWWGDAAGPGAEPADLACGVNTTVTASATAPFKIKVKGLR